MWLLLSTWGCGGLDGDGKPDASEPTGTVPAPVCAAASWSWGTDNGVGAAEASFVGEAEGDLAGGELLAPGDMDGDGVGDLVIAAPFNQEGGEDAGKVYVVGGRTRAAGQALADAPAVVGDRAGYQLSNLAAVGDTDGDGLADVSLAGGFQGGDPGDGVYLVRGRAGGWTGGRALADADAVATDALFAGGTGQEGRGPAADFDGDGLADWALAQSGGYNGELRVVAGADATGAITTPDAAMVWLYGAGDPVRFTGWTDLDGDGLADVVADTRDGSGSFVLYAADGRAYEEAVTARATTSVWDVESGLLGDLDGDGLAELVVRPSDGEPDGVGLFFDLAPGRPGLSFADADLHLAPGEAVDVAWVGDVDGDGLGDLAAWADRGDGPGVHLWFGRTSWPAVTTLADADVHIVGEAGRELRLPTPEQVGDVDGDGIDDLLLLAPGEAVDGTAGAGVITLFHGRSTWEAELGLTDAEARFVGSALDLGLGDVLLVEDLDGDGCDEVVTSSVQSDPSGTTFVFYGQPRR